MNCPVQPVSYHSVCVWWESCWEGKTFLRNLPCPDCWVLPSRGNRSRVFSGNNPGLKTDSNLRFFTFLVNVGETGNIRLDLNFLTTLVTYKIILMIEIRDGQRKLEITLENFGGSLCWWICVCVELSQVNALNKYVLFMSTSAHVPTHTGRPWWGHHHETRPPSG